MWSAKAKVINGEVYNAPTLRRNTFRHMQQIIQCRVTAYLYQLVPTCNNASNADKFVVLEHEVYEIAFTTLSHAQKAAGKIHL